MRRQHEDRRVGRQVDGDHDQHAPPSARGRARVGFFSSPASCGTHCQPSYAPITRISAKPKPGQLCGAIVTLERHSGSMPSESAYARAASITRPPTLIHVAVFSTSAPTRTGTNVESDQHQQRRGADLTFPSLQRRNDARERLAEDQCAPCIRRGVRDKHSPAEEERGPRTVGLAQEHVHSAGVRKRGGHLGERQCARERDRSAEHPQQNERADAIDATGDESGCLEDATANHGADDHRGGRPRAHLAGESRFCGRGARCERHLGSGSLARIGCGSWISRDRVSGNRKQRNDD